MVDLAKLVVRMEADNKRLHADLERSQKQVKKFERNTKKSLSNIENNFTRIAGVAGGFVKAVAGLAGLGVGISSINRLRNEIDELQKASLRADVSVEALQEISLAAELLGISSVQVGEGLTRLSKRLGEFKVLGAGPAAKGFEAIGISAEQARQRFQTTEQAFDFIIRTLEGITDSSERAALASKFFGVQVGPRLALLASQGVGGLDKLREGARDTNVILGTDGVNAVADFNDEITKLSKTISTTLAGAFVGIVEKLNQTVSRFENFSARLKAISSDEVLKVQKQIEAQQRNLNDLIKQQAKNTGVDFSKSIEIAEKNIARLESKLKSLIKTGQEARKALTGSVPTGAVTPPTAPSVTAITPKGPASAIKTGEPITATSINARILDALRPIAAGQKELVRANEKVKEITDNTNKWEKETKRVEDAAKDLGFVFESRLENVIVEMTNRTIKLREVVRALAQDILRVVTRRAITEPLGQAVSAGVSALGGAVTNYFVDARGASGNTEAAVGKALNAAPQQFDAAVQNAWQESLARGGQGTPFVP